MKLPEPNRPSDDGPDDDELDEEDREFIGYLIKKFGPEEERTDEENLQFLGALLRYKGLDPSDDVVFIKDDDEAFGYRVELKTDYLKLRHEAAVSAEFMSQYLRYECDYSPFTVAGMSLAEMTEAFRTEIDADGGA